MFKKLAVLLGVFAMMFVTFFGSGAYAAKYYTWRTDDGKYEMSVTVWNKKYTNVMFKIYDVYYVNHRTGKATSTKNYSPLSVRLCNTSSGKCTSFKKFNKSGSVTFTNMKLGTYYVDIRDSWADYYFKGKITGNWED